MSNLGAATVRWVTGVLAVLGVAVLSVPPLGAQDLFEEVFGDATEQEVVIPVTRDGTYLGEVAGRRQGSDMTFRLVDFIAAVEQVVDEQTIEDLRGLLTEGEDTYVDMDALGQVGIFTGYLSERVELQVTIAPERLREQFLNTDRARYTPNIQEPATVSGYLNLRSTGAVSTDTDQNTLTGQFDPVVNVRGWVLEGSTTVSTGEDPFQLNTARLVYDIVDRQLRTQAGILGYSTGRLFGKPEILGLGVHRVERMRPDRGLTQSGEISFVVPREGRVNVLVNGRSFRSFTLNEGPHTVANVPFASGTNSFQVVHETDSDEENQVLLERDLLFSSQLLRPGRHTYSYAAGVLRDNLERPFAGAHHQYGLFQNLTLTGAAQGTVDRGGFGVGVVGTGLWGVFEVDSAITVGPGLGVAGGASHTVSLLNAQWTPGFELSVTAQNAKFIDVASGLSTGTTVEVGLNYTQQLPGAVNTGLAVANRQALDGTGRSQTEVRLSVSHRSQQGYSLSARIGPTITDGDVSWQGSVLVRISGGERITTTAGYNATGGPATLSVAGRPEQALGGIQWNAALRGIDRTEGTPQVAAGTVGYQGYRFGAQVNPQIQRSAGIDTGSARLGGSFSSALAFADRTVAVSRPIRDSFVVFSPRSSVASHRIPIQGGSSGAVAVINGRPAVVPGVPSYLSTTITLSAENLPDGYSLGEEEYSFQPTYRRGYAVEIGSMAAVYVRGRLISDRGEPIALQAGELVATDGTSTMFFTNQDGHFEVTNLVAGEEYELGLYADTDGKVVFGIPEDAAGLYELDDVLFLEEEQ
ncbi:MAG: fimbria/pilus outer membrane usher protein [Alkalispirochaeta sp.]